MAGVAVLLTLGLILAGCSQGGGGDGTGIIWLKDLNNPFIGKWQSEIPSTDYATLKFDFKQDGTFTCEFPAGPDTTMTANGGYLVNGNVQLSFMSFDGGIGGYTFTVADNDTINVTEIAEVKEDGAIVSGNTAPFTRSSGSAINKVNKSFVLYNALIGGKWKETSTAYQAEYQFKADGSGTMKYQAGGETVSSEIAYFAFYDEGIQTNVLVTFMPDTNGFTAYAFTTPAGNTTTVKEITEVVMEAQGPSATYGEAVPFTRGY